MPISTTFLKARIEFYETAIVEYEAAILAIGSGAAQTYKIDTGQTVVTVTKLNLTEIENALERMLNQLAVLYARLDGSGVRQVRPGF